MSGCRLMRVFRCLLVCISLATARGASLPEASSSQSDENRHPSWPIALISTRDNGDASTYHWRIVRDTASRLRLGWFSDDHGEISAYTGEITPRSDKGPIDLQLLVEKNDGFFRVVYEYSTGQGNVPVRKEHRIELPKQCILKESHLLDRVILTNVRYQALWTGTVIHVHKHGTERRFTVRFVAKATKDNEPADSFSPPFDPLPIPPDWPFVVTGRVTDERGQGMYGVTVVANTGFGTLRRGGETVTDAEGRYRLRFGPGIAFKRDATRPMGVGLQAAVITARKPGLHEANECRNGKLAMAETVPDPAEMRNSGYVGVVLPDTPYQLDFVMLPPEGSEGEPSDEKGSKEASPSPAAMFSFGPRTPIPEGAKVILSTDKEEYFLGENILVHFMLANLGRDPFTAEFGGDYRGAPRSLRFLVGASDASGRPVTDPYPNSMCMGGLGGPVTVTRGKPFYQSLPMLRYLLFEEPGTYTVSVRHDCGWQESADRKYPEGRITLHLKRPSPEQAAKLVETWRAQKPYQGTRHGHKSAPYPDFSVIRYAAYLAPLAEHADRGSAEALTGIGSIATPEATRALIDLLETEDDDFRAQVCGQLGARLPDPYLEGLLGKRNPFEDDMKALRRRLVERSWRPEFANETRRHAARFLDDSRTEWVAKGAYFIECVGRPSEAILIERALDREVARTLTLEFEEGLYPRPRGACQELLRAARVLLKRGAEAPAHPASPGQSMFFLLALKNDETFRPDGWIDTCDRLLSCGIPYVSEQTLAALPKPIPEALRRHLGPVLAAQDIDAAIAACRIVERDKLLDLKAPVLSICATAREPWLFRAAGNAVHALDADYEHLEILVSRLDEPDLLFERLDRLKTIVFDNVGGGGFSSNIGVEAKAARIKPKWQTFIATHETYLKAGGKFTLPDPNVPPEMFPAEYFITLKDGRHWP